MTDEREISRFDCVSGNGTRYTVREIQHYVPTESLAPPGPRMMAGMREFITTTGLRVNHRPGIGYELVQTGEILQRV